jgi:arginine deiminase
MSMKSIDIKVSSEIGDLQAVILHSPGSEVENMTPQNAERALYSDILNLTVAKREYEEFKGALEKITHTFEVKDLLEFILKDDKVKETLVKRILKSEQIERYERHIIDLDNKEIARRLIEGGEMVVNNLTKFLEHDRYTLKPLHNFFFMRDASIAVNKRVLIAQMANQVREREAIIMESIFDFHPLFNTKTVNPQTLARTMHNLSIEGGDVLVARHDILLIGLSSRTSSQGIDFIIECLKTTKGKRHIIVQELPKKPESFIHLDMAFTFIDKDMCMIYEPVIMQANRFRTIGITVNNGKVTSIEETANIFSGLKKLGMDLKPIHCGGNSNAYTMEREQWHSGTNFFAVGPGKVIGYERNVYTIEELNNHGFEVISATDVVSGARDPEAYDKYVITIKGSELARGGGGARCMTMPVLRSDVDW